MTAIVIPNTFLPSTTISSTAMNANFQEVVDGLAASMAIDGSDAMTGQLKIGAGTAAAPGLAFGVDLNLGIYRRGVDELGFSTAGVLRGYFDAAGKLFALGAADITGAVDIGGALVVDGAFSVAGLGTFAAGITLSGGSLTGFPVASETVVGFTEHATDAEVRAATTGNLAVTATKLETAAAPVTLTDAATIAVDWDTFVNGVVTLAGNRTLGNPTNGQVGTWRRIQFNQDATGSRTITWSNQFVHPGGTDMVLSTAANAIDTCYIYCRSTTVFEVHVGGKAWAT